MSAPLFQMTHQEFPVSDAFCCIQCSKKFPTKTKLNRHMLVHTNEKPHLCNICFKRFNIKSNGIRHLVAVHEIPNNMAVDFLKHDVIAGSRLF